MSTGRTEYALSAKTWGEISLLRQHLIDNEDIAEGILTSPRDTLERIGLDVAFPDSNGNDGQLSDILEAMDVRQRGDILKSLGGAEVRLDDGLTDTQLVLVVNAVVFVNVGGFVNAALVTNAVTFANAASAMNVATVGGGVVERTVDASSGNIILTEDFLVSELNTHMSRLGLSKYRQHALLGHVVRTYQDELAEALEAGPKPYRFQYKDLTFDVTIRATEQGALEICGGSVLN